MNSLLFGIALLAAPATDTVTLEMMAKPVGEVVAEVARQTQLPITADVSTASRPVFIAVDKMPVKVFLERLAKITDCEWHARGASSVLTRGNRAQAAIVAERRERARLLPQGIAQARAELERRSLASESRVEQRVKEILRQKSEAERNGPDEYRYHLDSHATYAGVLLEFLAKVSPETLADLTPGEPVVFSSDPNALQRPFPYAPRALEQALANQDLLYKRLVSAGVRFNSPQGFATVVPPARTVPAKMLVRAEAHEGSTTLHLFILDAAGQLVGQSSSSFAHQRSAPPRMTLSGGNEMIALSAESSTFVKAFRESGGWASSRTRAYGGGKFDALAPLELRERMRRPTEYEPQRLIIADLWLGWRQHHKESLMANVSDGLFLSLLSQPGAQLRLSSLWANGQHTFTRDQTGWLVHPRSWAVADRESMDRRALQNLLDGTPDLAKAVAYAKSTTPRQSLGGLYLMLLDQPTYEVVTTRHPMLLLLGQIPGAVHQDNAEWSVMTLPKPARDQALRLLLTSNLSARMPRPGGGRTHYVEATESFRFEVDWRLGVRRRRGETLCTLVNGKPGVIVSPQELGQRTGYPRSHYQWLPPSQVAVLTCDDIDAALGAGDTVVRYPLRFLTPGGRLTPLNVDELPAEMKAAYEAGRRSVAQNQGVFGRSGGTIPPQP